MQNVETVKIPWYRPCARCGKQCFSDLLDSEGLCDYCREVKAMKAAVIRKTAKRKALK